MRFVIVFASVFVAVTFIAASATIINIPDDYPTIQQGIDICREGDTVLVADGTYTGNGNRDIDFAGKSILVISENGPEYTVIDCQGSVPNAYRGFYFHSGEDSTSVVSGFTILDGYAHSRGGGIYCSGSSPSIINCHITQCRTGSYGGGFYSQANSAPVIRSCRFSGNSSGSYGGGLYCKSSRVFIADCTIETNRSSFRGGGACFWDATGTIVGCVIRDNFAVLAGGGATCILSDSLIFEDCIFVDNTTDGSAGGLYCQYSSPTLLGCWFTGNFSPYSGGLQGEFDSSPILIRCVFEQNEAYGGAGAAFTDNCYPVLIECVFDHNESSGGQGGALTFYESGGIIANNLFIRNSANGGGAISMYDSDLVISGNTFSENLSYGWYGYGGGISCLWHSFPILTNDIFWGDSSSEGHDEIYVDSTSAAFVSFSNIQGGWAGEGNIDTVPLFRDPENSDFHLMSTECGDPYDSPCIDTGSPAIIDSLLDCSWGLGTILSDMGAYGGGDSATVGIEDFADLLPERLSLLQNYPNPFNASTLISYSLPQVSDVKITIYDILGRRIETLVQGEQPAGYHQVVWDAEYQSSGIYIYYVKAGAYMESKSCLLLK